MTTEAAIKAWRTRRRLDPQRWGRRRKPQKLKLKTTEFIPNERNIIDKSQLLDTDKKKDQLRVSGDHTT